MLSDSIYANNRAAQAASQMAMPSAVKDQPLTAEIGERLSHSLDIAERTYKTLYELKCRLYGDFEPQSASNTNATQAPPRATFEGAYREGQAMLTQKLLNIETLAMELASRT